MWPTLISHSGPQNFGTKAWLLLLLVILIFNQDIYLWPEDGT
jgi:hypothetical protein